MFQKWNEKTSAKYAGFLAHIVLSALLYWAIAKLGMLVATINKQASPVWPATGIAFLLVYRMGWRACFGIFVGAFIANFMTALPWAAAALIAVGNLLESITAVTLFRFFSKKSSYFSGQFSIVNLLVALVFGCVVSASFGTFSLWWVGVLKNEQALYNWSTWMVGDLLGALYTIPFFETVLKNRWHVWKIVYYRYWKWAGCVALTICLNLFIFSDFRNGRYLFFIFSILLFSRIWLSYFWTLFFCLCTCGYAIFQTIQKNGPFFSGAQNDNLLQLQFFLIGLIMTAMAFDGLDLKRRSYGTIAALLIGWTLSGSIFYALCNSSIEKENLMFRNQVSKAEEALKTALEEYATVLKSGVGFVKASSYVSREAWRSFVTALGDTEFFKGIHGFGLIYSTPTSDLNRLLSMGFLNQRDLPKEIHPVVNLEKEKIVSHPDRHLIITYLEPIEKNHKAIGLDVATELYRYEAAVAALESGMPTLTNQIQLVQDNEKRSGVLFYAPFVIERPRGGEQNKSGLVYMPIVVEDFVKSALSKFDNELEFQMYFGDDASKKNRVYSDFSEDRSQTGVIESRMKLMGLPIIYRWQRSGTFPSFLGLTASVMGLMGALVTLLLAGLISSLQRTSDKAQRLAKERTLELQRQTETWKVLVEKSPVGIYLLNYRGECTYVNPAWLNLTGISFSQALGDGWAKWIHSGDKQTIFKGWSELQSGKDFHVSYRYVKSNGDIVPVKGLVAPIIDGSGHMVGSIGTVADMTEVYEKQKALIVSSRMSNLGEMASGLAHEINNPLAIIQSKARRLKKIVQASSVSSELIESDFDVIFETVYRIAKITRSMQAFVGEGYDGPAVAVSIRDVILEVSDFCRARFQSHGVDLKMPTGIDESIQFSGRKELISQVLVILLNNAFDAVQSAYRRQVCVAVQYGGPEIEIYVTDTGSGIPEALVGKLFDPVFSNRPSEQSAGFGLSIAKNLVEQHHGKICLLKRKNLTTFQVKIPRVGFAFSGKVG